MALISLFTSFLLPLLLSTHLHLAAAAAAAAATPAAATPDALPLVKQLSFSGSGCPSSGPGVSSVGGANDPSFVLGNFVAETPGENTTVNCEAHITYTGGSPGWQLAVDRVHFKGYTDVGSGAELNWYIQQFWSESAANTVTVSGTLDGPAKGTYAVDKDVSNLYSKCVGSDGSVGILNVNFRIALNGHGGKAFFGPNGSQKPTEDWEYVWRQC